MTIDFKTLADKNKPTHDQLRRGDRGKGTWEQLTYWDLPQNHRLKFYTYKNTNGYLVTNASVCKWEQCDGYQSEKFAVGVSSGGDLFMRLANMPVRVTEKAVREQHLLMLMEHFDKVLQLTVEKYGSKMKLAGAPRPIKDIAYEIRRTWPKVYFGAEPYLQAMCHLNGVNDTYGADSAKEVVTYFLGNASTWRGDDAKRIKAELKSMFNIK